MKSSDQLKTGEAIRGCINLRKKIWQPRECSSHCLTRKFLLHRTLRAEFKIQKWWRILGWRIAWKNSWPPFQHSLSLAKLVFFWGGWWICSRTKALDIYASVQSFVGMCNRPRCGFSKSMTIVHPIFFSLGLLGQGLFWAWYVNSFVSFFDGHHSFLLLRNVYERRKNTPVVSTFVPAFSKAIANRGIFPNC